MTEKPQKTKDRIKKLPNQLTWLRMIAIPFIVLLMLEGKNHTPGKSFIPEMVDYLAASLFALAAITDFFDGWIARKFKVESLTGKLLDPLADKLLVVSSLIILVGQHRLAAWIAVVIIVRDLAINAIRNAALEENIVISSSTLGKTKTFILDFGIIFLILNGTWDQGFFYRPLGLLLVYTALTVSIVSGAQYVIEYAKEFKKRV